MVWNFKEYKIVFYPFGAQATTENCIPLRGTGQSYCRLPAGRQEGNFLAICTLKLVHIL